MSTTDSIDDELARLRRDVDDIKASIGGSSGKTTKVQRASLRKHIEDLDKIFEKNKRPKKIQVKNTFKIGQLVELVEFRKDRTKGIVKFLTCRKALPSIKECDNECAH